MKKYLYLTAALAIVGAVSCNKEISDNTTPDAPEVKLATLTATIGEPGTKTTLATPDDAHINGSKTYWCAEDRLSVFDGENNVEYSVKESENYEAAEEAVFEGEELAEAEGYYALYPYTETATLEDGTIKGAVLPANQTAVAGNIPEGAALAVAYTEDRSEVYFKNVATTIGFTLTEAAGKVEFIAKGNENIAGTIDITFDGEGLPTYEVQDGKGSNTITLTNLAVGTYYFTILPDVTLTQGYELKIDDVLAKIGAVGTQLKRSIIYSLGEVEKPKSWGICGTMNSWGTEHDIVMVFDGKWYVAENVSIKKSDAFQFRLDNEWNTQKTYIATKADVDVEYDLLDGAGGVGDITTVASAIYNVFLSSDAKKFKLIKVDDIPLPDPKNWGIVGSMTNWGNDILMTLNGDWYEVSDVKMPAGTTFKFRVDGKWASEGGEELTYSGNDAADGQEHAVTAGSDNITVNTAGVYNIYLSRDETMMKMVKTDEYVAPEPDPEEPSPSDVKTIYLDAGVWDDDNNIVEVFEAWYWGDGITAAWAKFTNVSGDIYKTSVPNGVTGMKFLRKGPDHATEEWESHNDSGDQSIPTGKNCFKVKGWNSYEWVIYTEE